MPLEDTLNLPGYTPSHPSPGYSLDPTDTETRLDLVPQARTGAHSAHTGVFTKTFGKTLVALLDQEENIEIPSYEKEGRIRGTVVFEEDTYGISELVIKLEGRLEVTAVDAGALILKTVKETSSLWSPTPSSTKCPKTLDFAFKLPATFQHLGQNYPLPPTYEARFSGFPALFAKITYSLKIVITKARLGFLSKTKSLNVVFNYKPRLVPPRGISPSPGFLSGLKIMPEEWYQSSFVMNARSSSKLAPIQCHMVIPSVKIFGLSDTIPVHLQISGPISSLRQLISPPKELTEKYVHDPLSQVAVRVYLTRMVSFDASSKTSWRLSTIGEGSAWPLPPCVDYDCVCCEDTHICKACLGRIETLDWDGEVKCNKDVSIGGYSAAGLNVKDFITLELVPPDPKSSQFITVKHAIPIRLVTDSFVSFS